MDDDKTFGEILREYRIKKNMCQKELAKLLGITPHTVCRYEHGDFMPIHYSMYLKISDILDIPMEVLGKIACLKTQNTRTFREQNRYKNTPRR